MANSVLAGLVGYLRRAAASEDGVSDADLLSRFVDQRDEAAFELLVWRHGRMVLGVCQRMLRNSCDAEDAFQATFLTLARRAKSVARREAIAGWLYHVACHTAQDARKRLHRRREQIGATPELLDSHDPSTEAAVRELHGLIDDEVQRLPEQFRLPFILCRLEGRSNAEAAQILRCPVGTIESRLTRADNVSMLA